MKKSSLKEPSPPTSARNNRHPVDIDAKSAANMTERQKDNESSGIKSQQNRRRATFQGRVRGVMIPSHRDFSDEEHGNTWMTEEDDEQSHAHIVETIRAIRKKIRRGQPMPSCLNDTDELCVRGLEKTHTTQSGQIVENRKTAVRSAVLEEQRRQKESNKPDMRKIARASMALSCQSLDVAIAQAAKDAAFVNVRVRGNSVSARRQRSLDLVSEVEVAIQNIDISDSGGGEQQSDPSLLSSSTNPNQAQRRDSSFTTIDASSPTNPNQEQRRDSSLTTLDDQSTAERSQGSNLSNPNEHSNRSMESTAAVVATDSASTISSRRSTRSVGSRALIRQGRMPYQPREEPDNRSP